MANRHSNSGETLLSPHAFWARDIVLGHELVHLPLFARLYRGAFKSGAGADVSPFKRLFCRIGYYLLGGVLQTPQWGSMRLEVRGQMRQVCFDCRNRQFNSLYFRKYANGYEPAVSAALLTLLTAGGVLYDVGSNWGYYALLIARRKEFRGRVHAFEPWPSSFANLSSVVEQAQLGELVQTHAVALAADSGWAAMVSRRHSGLARVVPGSSGVRVPKQRLDDMPLEPPTLVKLDVEGFEAEVLRGGEKILRTAQPFLVFESAVDDMGGTADALQLLETWGYRLFIPALTGAEPDGSGTLAVEAPKAGAVSLRMVLHPLSSRSRSLHLNWLNLLACPASRACELAPLVEAA